MLNHNQLMTFMYKPSSVSGKKHFQVEDTQLITTIKLVSQPTIKQEFSKKINHRIQQNYS